MSAPAGDGGDECSAERSCQYLVTGDRPMQRERRSSLSALTTYCHQPTGSPSIARPGPPTAVLPRAAMNSPAPGHAGSRAVAEFSAPIVLALRRSVHVASHEGT